MKNKRALFPNFLTVLGLFLGFMAIISVLNGEYIRAAWLIGFAAIADAMDGKVARLVKSSSPFGVEFDSLTDLVSCGVAPALLYYEVYLYKLGFLGAVISFIPVFAAGFRLARFNISLDEDFSKSHFVGLPVPLFAMTASSYVVFNYHIWDGIRFTQSVIPFILFLSLLMISQVHYITFPNFTLSGSRGNTVKFVLFILGFILFLLIPQLIIFPSCFGIVLAGLIRWVAIRIRESGEDEKEVMDYSR